MEEEVDDMSSQREFKIKTEPPEYCSSDLWCSQQITSAIDPLAVKNEEQEDVEESKPRVVVTRPCCVLLDRAEVERFLREAEENKSKVVLTRPCCILLDLAEVEKFFQEARHTNSPQQDFASRHSGPPALRQRANSEQEDFSSTYEEDSTRSCSETSLHSESPASEKLASESESRVSDKETATESERLEPPQQIVTRQKSTVQQNNTPSSSKVTKLSCDILCSQTFRLSRSLYLHKVHHEKLIHSCAHCDFKFHIRKQLRLHTRRVHQLELPKSDKFKGPGPFKCTQCSKVFPRIYYLVEHKRVHTGERPYVCPICSKTFAKLSCFSNHKAIHRKPTYCCGQCDTKCTSKANLDNHIQRIHLNERRFKCGFCTQTFKINSDMRAHERNIHKGNARRCCEICGLWLRSRVSLNSHFLFMHKDLTKFPCKKCDFVADTILKLRSHIKDTHKDFVTIETNNLYSDKPKKSENTYVQHRFKKMYKSFGCRLCPKAFKTKNELLNHHKTHFQCDICNKQFKYSFKLIQHQQYHTKNYHFVCEICSKGFFCKRDFKRHCESHEPKLPCKLCKFKFRNKDTLERHITTYHMKICITNFECEYCKNKFLTKCKLRDHLKSSHNIRPCVKCNQCSATI